MLSTERDYEKARNEGTLDKYFSNILNSDVSKEYIQNLLGNGIKIESIQVLSKLSDNIDQIEGYEKISGRVYHSKDGSKIIIIAENQEGLNEAFGTLSEEGYHAKLRQQNNIKDSESYASYFGDRIKDYYKNKYGQTEGIIIFDGLQNYTKDQLGNDYENDVALYHGGGPGTVAGIMGLANIINYEKYTPEIDHNGMLDWIGLRVHNKPDVASSVIGEYKHKETIIKISVGYSMSGDAFMIAASDASTNKDNKLRGSQELISVYGRISYIERYLPSITKEVTEKIYFVNLDGDNHWVPGLGFRSFQSIQKMIKRMEKKGELKLNENGYYVNKNGVEVKFLEMSEGTHGGVMMKESSVLEVLIDKLKSAGSKIPLMEKSVLKNPVTNIGGN